MGKTEEVRRILKSEIGPQKLSYGKMAERLGISKGALYRFVNDPDYVPRSPKLCEKLGLIPGHDFVIQVVRRDEKGRFT